MKLFILIAISALLMGVNAFAASSLGVSITGPSSAYINQLVTANVVISNTGSSNLNLSAIQITANYNGSGNAKIPAAYSTFNLGPNAPVVTIQPGASNSVTVPMQAVFFSPSTGITDSGSGQYYIGAIVQDSSGNVTSAVSGPILKVHPVTLPASERQ